MTTFQRDPIQPWLYRPIDGTSQGSGAYTTANTTENPVGSHLYDFSVDPRYTSPGTSRLRRGTIKMGVAFPEAFADWTNPQVSELNGPLSFDLTPALVEAGSKFNLEASTVQSYIPFAATTAVNDLTFFQPSVAYEFNRSTSPTASDQANLAYQLLGFADTHLFVWSRIGPDSAIGFGPGDRVSMVRVKTDWPVETVSSGKVVTMTQSFLPDGDLIWSHPLPDPAVFTVQDNGSGSYTGYGPITDNGSGVLSTNASGVTLTNGVLSF